MTNEKTPEVANETATPKKGSSKKILLLALGLLLLAAGGALGWHFFSRKAAASGPAPTAPLTLVHLNKFIVNLADTDRDAYLKVSIDLGVTGPVSKGEDGDQKVPVPEIRDTILAVMTTCHSSDLLTPAGKMQLKRNLINALDRRVPKLGVRQVYFTDFLVQR